MKRLFLHILYIFLGFFVLASRIEERSQIFLSLGFNSQSVSQLINTQLPGCRAVNTLTGTHKINSGLPPVSPDTWKRTWKTKEFSVYLLENERKYLVRQYENLSSGSGIRCGLCKHIYETITFYCRVPSYHLRTPPYPGVHLRVYRILKMLNLNAGLHQTRPHKIDLTNLFYLYLTISHFPYQHCS